MSPEIIADYECVCGENPLWHPDERRLYWVDIPTGRMFRYDPRTDAHEQCYQGDVVGGFTIQEDGDLLLFMARGAIKTWRDGFRRTVIDELPGEEDSRFNDVVADPEGRVFCGTMATENRPGRLYLLERDGTITKVLDGIGCSNGLGFTPELSQMYYTDSLAYTIYRFDYDRATGALTNRKVFLQLPQGGPLPDGMTVDAEGFVWSALWDGGCVARYRPDGTEDRRIPLPAKQVTSLIFGGDDYSDLYITTAGGTDKKAHGPGAGALFRLRAGIRGVPEFRSRILL